MKDNRVSVISADRAFNKAGSINDQVKLPLVTVWRPGYSFYDTVNTTAGIFRGTPATISDDQTSITSLQYLPLHIDYQLDVFTRTREENDELVREIIWYFKLYPQIKITIPYNLNKPITFNIFFNSDITDNSELTEFENRGQYYRSTLSMYTDEGKLFKVREDSVKYLDITLGVEVRVEEEGG